MRYINMEIITRPASQSSRTGTRTTVIDICTNPHIVAWCRVTGRGYMDVNRISGYIPGKMVFFLMQVKHTPSMPVHCLRTCSLDSGTMSAKSPVPLKGISTSMNLTGSKCIQGRYWQVRQGSMCRFAKQGLPDCGRSG